MSPTSDPAGPPTTTSPSSTVDPDVPPDLSGERARDAVIHEPGISAGTVAVVVAFAIAAVFLIYRSMSAAFDEVRDAKIVLTTSGSPAADDAVPTGDLGPASAPAAAAVPSPAPDTASAYLVDRALMESSSAVELLGAVPTLVQLRPRRELLLDTGAVVVEGQRLETGTELVAIEPDRLLLRSGGRELEIALR